MSVILRVDPHAWGMVDFLAPDAFECVLHRGADQIALLPADAPESVLQVQSDIESADVFALQFVGVLALCFVAHWLIASMKTQMKESNEPVRHKAQS